MAIALIEIDRPKPIEAYDPKFGPILIVFDNITEEGALEVMMKFLTEGMPEERVVKKVPDFLRDIVID